MASYTQVWQFYNAPNTNDWITYDVEATKGIPANSVVEVIGSHNRAASLATVGAREVGSGLARTISLNEAEDGGYTAARFLVNVDSNGEIELWGDINQNIRYSFVGYWEDVTFTEQWDDHNVTSKQDDMWFELLDGPGDLGLVADRVHLITLVNSNTGTQDWLGVREAGGADPDRRLEVMEAEGGGVQTASMYVLADGSGNIDVYTSDYADVYFINQGYFDAAIDFTEKWTEIVHLGIGVWDDHDISGEIDADGRVCDFLVTHISATGEMLIGVRKTDTGDNRYFDIREAEGDGNSGYGMSTQTNSVGEIDTYAESNISVDIFLTGYFNVGTAGTNEYEETPSETLNLADLIPKETTTMKVDASTLSSVLLLGPSSSYIEMITLSDTIEKLNFLAKTVSESLTLTDTFTEALELYRTFTDPFNISDVFERDATFIRTLTDTADLTDPAVLISAQRIVTKSVSEIVNMEDVFTRQMETYRTYPEILSLTDIFYVDIESVYLESLVVTDNMTSILGQIRTWTEPLNISDLDVIIQVGLSLEQTETLNATISLLFGVERIYSENINLTDVITKIATFNRTWIEPLILVDSVELLKLINQNLTETATLIDTYTDLFASLRTYNENVILTDSYVLDLEFFRILTDLLNLTDLTVEALAAQIFVGIETLNLTDTYTRQATLIRAFNDITSLTDDFILLLNYLRTLAENTALTTSLTIDGGYSMSESLNLLDSRTLDLTLLRTFIGNLNLTDLTIDLVTAGLVQKTLTETMILLDTYLRTFVTSRTLLDIVDLTDLTVGTIHTPGAGFYSEVLTESATLLATMFTQSSLLKIYADYIYLVKPGTKVIYEDDESGWVTMFEGSGGSIDGGSSSISEEIIEVKSGESSLKVIAASGGASSWMICRKTELTLDLSDKDFLPLLIYGLNDSGAIRVLIVDSGGTGTDIIYWNLTDNWAGWKLIYLDLNNPTFEGGTFDISDVVEARIYFATPGTRYIDRMTLETSEGYITKDVAKAPFTETLSLIDSILLSVSTSMSEAVTLLDGLTFDVGKFIIETLTLIDDVTSGGAVSQLFTEMMILTDTRLLFTQRLLSEASTLTEGYITKNVDKMFDESIISLSDIASKTVAKIIIELSSLTDTLAALQAIPYDETFTETMSLTAIMLRMPGWNPVEVITLINPTAIILALYKIIAQVEILNVLIKTLELELVRNAETLNTFQKTLDLEMVRSSETLNTFQKELKLKRKG